MPTPPSNCAPPATPDWKPPSKPTIRAANALLAERYGTREVKARDPLDGLVLIILSQATSDVNCDRAFSSLKRAFPTWEQVLGATDEQVADAIRSGGLANQKSRRIRVLLREIKQERGELDLSWMHHASADECEAYLQKFHGVGPKTIACVLVFFLRKPAFPVDTHVLRVTRRLGWLRDKAGAEEAHRVFKTQVPDECKLDLHVNLIAHGREICRADGNGGPKCHLCLLRPKCALGKRVRGAGDAGTPQVLERAHGGDFFVTVEPGMKSEKPLDVTEVIVEEMEEMNE